MEKELKPQGTTLSNILNVYSLIFTFIYVAIAFPIISACMPLFNAAISMPQEVAELGMKNMMTGSILLIIVGILLIYPFTLFAISGFISTSHKKYTYIFSEKGILIKSGFLARKNEFIPWELIHKAETSQNKVQEIFNLGDIKLQKKTNLGMQTIQTLFDIKDVNEISFQINRNIGQI